MVPVVDLRYMLEGHCLFACPSPLRLVRGELTVVISSIFGTEHGEYQSTALIYQPFVLV